LFVVVCAVAIIWIERRSRIEERLDRINRHKDPTSRCPKEPLRLFLNPGMARLIYVLTLGILSVVIILFIDELQQLFSQDTTSGFLDKRWTNMMYTLNDIAVIGLTLLVPLIWYSRQVLKIVLDDVFDVINYYRPDKNEASLLWMKTYERSQFEIRKKVIKRFGAILEHFNALKKNREERQELVIVCHSQGTVFALEFMKDRLCRRALEKFESVKLVTMGSPFTHIYQYYLSGHCKALEAAILEIKPDWINLYRTDDYIGTYLTMNPQITEPDEIDYPKNIEVGPGGHTGYFHDKRVVPRIWDFVEGRTCYELNKNWDTYRMADLV
jgi:hypothetical protein